MVKPKKISKEDWDVLMEQFEGALMATGFEEALIGFGYQFNKPLAVYDRNKCLNIFHYFLPSNIFPIHVISVF